MSGASWKSSFRGTTWTCRAHWDPGANSMTKLCQSDSKTTAKWHLMSYHLSGQQVPQFHFVVWLCPRASVIHVRNYPGVGIGYHKKTLCPVCSSDANSWFMSEYKKKVMENSMKYALCHFIIQGEFLMQNTFLILFWENRMVLKTIPKYS